MVSVAPLGVCFALRSFTTSVAVGGRIPLVFDAELAIEIDWGDQAVAIFDFPCSVYKILFSVALEASGVVGGGCGIAATSHGAVGFGIDKAV